MDGFAIPHANHALMTQFVLVIIKLRAGIDWDSLDGQATRYSIAMFIPTNERKSTHMKVLSYIAGMVMLSDFKNGFISANSPSALATLFSEKLEVND